MTEPLLIIASYLLGSLSSAIIVCKLMRLPDPRSLGSNNPGATNVLRIGGKRAAAITLAGDIIKGLIPVLAAKLMGADDLILAMVAMAAFLGHLYPLFFGFKGGKGVATALGTQFGLGWEIGGSIALIWLIIAKGLNISSLAALVAMALAPLIVWHFSGHSGELLVMQIAMSLLLIWRHRSNIRNLISGAEGKISKEQGPEEQ
ncbi:MAG: glycerol-3-phosphate 1-O-acyltransferase PlsY [Sedimenticola sp.]